MLPQSLFQGAEALLLTILGETSCYLSSCLSLIVQSSSEAMYSMGLGWVFFQKPGDIYRMDAGSVFTAILKMTGLVLIYTKDLL